MTQLIKYDAMCRAIVEAHAVDEVKDIRDKAIAVEAYARQARNTDAERRACEIRLRAERKAGELLREMAERGERAQLGQGEGKGRTALPLPKLSDLGVSKTQSSQWQKLAEIPDGDFEAMLGSADKPSTAGLIRAVAPQMPVDPDALWLWGRLRDFEQRVLEQSPSDLMETMTDEMKNDVHSLAPRVSAWLKRIGATA